MTEWNDKKNDWLKFYEWMNEIKKRNERSVMKFFYWNEMKNKTDKKEDWLNEMTEIIKPWLSLKKVFDSYISLFLRDF